MSERKLKNSVEEFLVYIRNVRQLSENTSLGYQNDLKIMEEYLGGDAPLCGIGTEDLNFCITNLSSKGRAASSVNRFIAAVRSFFFYCRKFGYIQKNPALEVRTVKLPKYVPAFLTHDEIDRLCKEPEKNELLWEKRDKAIFESFYSTGCRVSELVSLKKSDFDYSRHAAKIVGKGNKERWVYFEKDAQNAIKDYLLDRERRFRSENVEDSSEFLFVNQNAGPLTSGGVRYILNRYTGKEGLNRHVSPHALRHTFATIMLSSGADIRVVQKFLGHSSISTTQRYTHLTTQQLIDIYKRCHPHAGGRTDI